MRAAPAMSYARDLVEKLTGVRPEPDHDGDLPIRAWGALFYARIMGDSRSWIQVFSVAIADIDASSDLALALNDINTQLRFARAFHVNRQVLFETEIWADDLNPGNFAHAFDNIALATDRFAPALHEAFGGRPVFAESQDQRYADEPRDSRLGFYL